MNGPWTSWYSGGIVKEKTGSYANNQLDKKWTFWSEDGKKTRVITYSNGMKNGPYMIWNDDNYKTIDGQYTQNQKIKFGQFAMIMVHQIKRKFLKGEKDGKWSWYRPDGSFRKRGNI